MVPEKPKIISMGKIRRVPVACPCCGTMYEIKLASEYNGDVRVIMSHEEDGYFPVIFMHCLVCNIYFQHVVKSKANKEGGNDVST